MPTELVTTEIQLAITKRQRCTLKSVQTSMNGGRDCYYQVSPPFPWRAKTCHTEVKTAAVPHPRLGQGLGGSWTGKSAWVNHGGPRPT